MLNIFYSRETADRGRFIWDKGKENTIVIVPDQYTLEGEREILRASGKDALFFLEVTGFSRLASRLIREKGPAPEFISREGRQMLISSIIEPARRQMQVFGRTASSFDFVTVMHDFIADLKQSGTDPQSLKETAESLEEGSILRKKLQDVYLVYEEYARRTEGRFMDNDDFMNMAADAVEDSELLKDRNIWIYGFDSFTGRHINFIKELEKTCREVNLLLNWDESAEGRILFEISGRTIAKLKEAVPEDRIRMEKVPDKYDREMSQTMRHIEKEYGKSSPERIQATEDIRIVKCSNPYYEACSAAAHVLYLIREKGMRYSDIAVLNNQLDENSRMYREVFRDYGMDIFIDANRMGFYHPAVSFVLSLLKMVSGGFRREDVILYLKSGFVTDDIAAVEKLEIYAVRFGITGGRWKSRFRSGLSMYTQEQLDEFEQLRSSFMGPVRKLEKNLAKAATCGEKVQCLCGFLDDDIGMPQMLEKLVERQEAEGRFEAAEETAQMWRKIVEILHQIRTLLGDEEIRNYRFTDMVRAGLEAIMVGLIPPDGDSLVMGNCQRSRREHIRAALITGANEGVLPSGSEEGGIISQDERDFLHEKNISICRAGHLNAMEEKAAVYRSIVKPSECLYISYAAASADGSRREPSVVVNSIKDMFTGLKEEKDVFNREGADALIGGYSSTRNNLITALESFLETGVIDEKWLQVYSWYRSRENMKPVTDRLFEGYHREGGDRHMVLELYGAEEGGELRVSPSRLELFAGCPFAHFMRYGLKPEEIREYSLEGTDTGTIFHQCIMEVSRILYDGIEEGGCPTDENSPWMNVKKEKVGEMIDRILMEISREYMEGILSENEYGRYRAQRIRKVCEDSMWMIINHVRRGNIKEMHFEVPFGKGRILPALELDTAAGRINIEGRIDRWDVLDGDFSKVIDYKSGRESFSREYAYAGLKLQLFIYLMAASRGKYSPGGAFYFRVDEAAAKMDENIDPQHDDEIIKQYRLDGFGIDDSRFRKGLDEDVSTPEVYNKGVKNSRFMSPDEFEELMEKVRNRAVMSGRGILEGNIDVAPKKMKDKAGCTYCPYRSICKFDTTQDGCVYVK